MTTDTAAERRNRLLERHVKAYVKDDGDVYVKRTAQRREPTSGDIIETTYERNLTKLFTAGKRTTGDDDILVIEAEAKADGKTGNWAEPIDDAVEAAARKRIERKGLTPAWEEE